MESRSQSKTIEEYVKALTCVASPEEVEKFKKLWNEGKRIHALQMLRQYQILE